MSSDPAASPEVPLSARRSSPRAASKPAKSSSKSSAPALPARWGEILGMVAFAVLAMYLWNRPVLGWALFPLKILVVTFHELSHAAVALLTGGHVVSIGLSPDEGGVTETTGGSALLILNAGYVGSLLWGVALLMSAKSARAAKGVAFALAAILAATDLLYVRPMISFGFVFTALAAAATALFAQKASADVTGRVLRWLGLFSVLYALHDIVEDVFRVDGATTDASMLADATHVPAIVWGVGWLAASLAVLWGLRRRIV